MTERECSKCGDRKPECEFHARSDRPSHKQSVCRDCMRDNWRAWNAKRRGSPGYQRGHYATMTEAPAQIVALAEGMSPDAKGVNVYRLADGTVAFWIGAMRAPKGAEFVGLYDFDAKAEYIAEDLLACEKHPLLAQVRMQAA